MVLDHDRVVDAGGVESFFHETGHVLVFLGPKGFVVIVARLVLYPLLLQSLETLGVG